MNSGEILKAIITAAITIGGGTFLFCSTTILSKLVIEPVLDLRKTIGELSEYLQYQGWVIHMGVGNATTERMDEVFEGLRKLSARLRSQAHLIPKYDLWAKMKLVPPKKNIMDAGGRLIRISNSLHNDKRWDTIHEDSKEVQRLLGIAIPKT